MSKHWTKIAAFASVLAFAGIAAAADTSPAKNDTYTWNAELVALDASAKTMTVKSRVAYQDAVSELKNLKPGDRVWVVWSGVENYSDAVRQVRRAEPSKRIDQNLVLPAEFVASEEPNQYITVRVKVPEGGMSAVEKLKPGEWVTVTAKHRPATDAEAVVAVKPYVTTTTSD